MLVPWVSFCRIGEYLVVFDLRANRYHAIPHVAQGGGNFDLDRPNKRLRAIFRSSGWVVEHPSDRPAVAAAETPMAHEAIACERPFSNPTRIGPGLLLEALVTILGVRYRLRMHSLEALAARVERDNNVADAHRRRWHRGDLIAHFGLARRILLGRDACLPAALALHTLLARHGYASKLIFGVKLHPFVAHCWIQAGDAILGDTIERAGMFTVIRVIA